MIRKTLLFTGLALAAFTSSLQAKERTIDYGPTEDVEDFYHADPNIIDYGHKRDTNPTYILVDRDDLDSVDQRYRNQGYIRIGYSSFIAGVWDGAPEKEYALNFARKIDADRIIYVLGSKYDSDIQMTRPTHWIGFYAKAH